MNFKQFEYDEKSSYEHNLMCFINYSKYEVSEINAKYGGKETFNPKRCEENFHTLFGHRAVV
tara:strand:- start:890 stop:1075 length:186 start_codon:yes stop_codon:yes gene_type:complete